MTTSRSSPALLWLFVAANGVAVIMACMRWVDRPVADHVNAMARQAPVFDWAARVLGSLHVVLVTAVLFLLWWSVQFLRRRPPGPWAVTPLLCASSVLGTLAAALWLKILVGRSQVYPGWIERREYSFAPLHGVSGYGAFPSATMAVTVAILSVIWIRAPHRRALCVLFGALVAAGIILTNGHWVSDVIGGALLGSFSAWLTLQRVRFPEAPAAAVPGTTSP